MTAIGRTPENIVRNKAKSDKVLADVLERIDTVSEKEIQSLPYMKYIKDGLLAAKHTVNHKSLLQLVLANTKTVYTPDFHGKIYRFKGDSVYLPHINTQVLLESESLVFISDSGEFWWDNMLLPHNKQLSLVYVSDSSFTKYKQTYQEDLNRRFGLVEIEPDGSNRTTSSGIRFTRF